MFEGKTPNKRDLYLLQVSIEEHNISKMLCFHITLSYLTLRDSRYPIHRAKEEIEQNKSHKSNKTIFMMNLPKGGGGLYYPTYTTASSGPDLQFQKQGQFQIFRFHKCQCKTNCTCSNFFWGEIGLKTTIFKLQKRFKHKKG